MGGSGSSKVRTRLQTWTQSRNHWARPCGVRIIARGLLVETPWLIATEPKSVRGWHAIPKPDRKPSES